MSKRAHGAGYGGPRPFKRSSFRTARGGYAGFAFKAPRKMARPGINVRTGGFTGIENKFIDTQTDDDSFTESWAAMEPATTNLSTVAQGDGESQRDGRVYVIDSIHLKGYIRLPGAELVADVPASVICRIVVVVDTQTNGTTIVATEVMDAGQTKDVLAFRNLQNTLRFKVIWDKTFTLQVNSVSHFAVNSFSNTETLRHFKYNHKFPGGLRVTMSSTEQSIANVRDNSIHLIGVCSPFDAAVVPKLHYQCRIRFRG